MSLRHKGEIEGSDTSPLSLPQMFLIPTVEETIYLFGHKNVWSPHSAEYFINQLIEAGIDFRGKVVLDEGCGGGILGIVAKKLGADFVYMSDLNRDALTLTAINAQHNGLKLGADYETIQSDGLTELIRNNIKVDIIIANVPMNPTIPGVHEDDLAARSNQNPGGRLVLDDLISKSKQILNPNGIVVASSSSRQNRVLTEHLYDENYPGSWEHLNRDPIDNLPGRNEQLVNSYHGPFIMHWKGEEAWDNIQRIYKLDENGLPYSEDQMSGNTTPENRKVRKIVSFINEDGRLNQYRVITNGRPENTRVYNNIPYDEEPKPIPDFPLEIIPQPHPTDHKLYHRYYISILRNTK